MTLDDLRHHCLAKSHTTEGLPFGPSVLVFKVAGKMFATIGLEEPRLRINLKCDPEKAVQLRDRYESVIPGYHSNKRHWNTVYVNGEDLRGELVEGWIDHSYQLVCKQMSKKKRDELGW